jgi:hypothetical protein
VEVGGEKAETKSLIAEGAVGFGVTAPERGKRRGSRKGEGARGESGRAERNGTRRFHFPSKPTTGRDGPEPRAARQDAFPSRERLPSREGRRRGETLMQTAEKGAGGWGKRVRKGSQNTRKEIRPRQTIKKKTERAAS